MINKHKIVVISIFTLLIALMSCEDKYIEDNYNFLISNNWKNDKINASCHIYSLDISSNFLKVKSGNSITSILYYDDESSKYYFDSYGVSDIDNDSFITIKNDNTLIYGPYSHELKRINNNIYEKNIILGKWKNLSSRLHEEKEIKEIPDENWVLEIECNINKEDNIYGYYLLRYIKRNLFQFDNTFGEDILLRVIDKDHIQITNNYSKKTYDLYSVK